MELAARERLAHLVKERVDKAGGQRVYARKLNVSQIAVQGWQRGNSVPSLENFLSIADEAGFTCEELITYLGMTQSPSQSDPDQVLKQMRLLAREELAKVVEAGVRMLATG